MLYLLLRLNTGMRGVVAAERTEAGASWHVGGKQLICWFPERCTSILCHAVLEDPPLLPIEAAHALQIRRVATCTAGPACQSRCS